MTDYFRVTVEDLKTGDKSCMEVAAGDYLVIPFAPCDVSNVQRYPGKGTVILTLKGHAPQGNAREVVS